MQNQIRIELRALRGYSWSMQRTLICASLMFWLAGSSPALAATGRVIKVLPHFLDLKGQHALSPSLYDRDAYQAFLRLHPEKRSGMRFDVQWKTKGPAWEPLKLRVELRGSARGDLPEQRILELPVEPTGWFGRWSSVQIAGEDYAKFGEVTAWRVTLWEGDLLLGEQKSFLW